MADNLWTLSQFLGRKDFNQKTIKMLNTIQPFLIEGRSDYTYWAQLLAKETTPHFEVIIVGPKAKSLAATLGLSQAFQRAQRVCKLALKGL